MVRIEHYTKERIADPEGDVSIGLLAETLQHLQLEAPYGVFIEEIAKTSRRMASLVHDLLDFARRRLGTQMPLVRRNCDAGDICAQVVDEVARVHPGRVIRLSLAGSTKGNWDPGRLGQLVSNLVGNAICHGADPILVAIAATDAGIRLDVENHGPEIPASDVADLFEAFRRRPTEGRPAGTGLGLGLYIVREIARAHGGTVTVSSTPDATRFTVELPRSPAADDPGRG